MDTAPNVVTLENPGEITGKRKPKKRKMKGANSIPQDLDGVQIAKTKDDNFTSQTEKSLMTHSTINQAPNNGAQIGAMLLKTSFVSADDNSVLEDRRTDHCMLGDKPRDGKKPKKKKRKVILEGDLHIEDHAKNVGGLADVAVDQVMQTPKTQLRKKVKKTKPASSHLEEFNQMAEATHVASEIISSDKPVSSSDAENTGKERLKDIPLVIGIAKPPQHAEADGIVSVSLTQRTEGDHCYQSPQNQFTPHLEENLCKPETLSDVKKNDACAEYIVTPSKDAVADTQNLNTDKKKKKKRKRNLSSVSQLELKVEDGTTNFLTEPKSMNSESKHSGDGNIVITGKDIPISYNRLGEMPVLNNQSMCNLNIIGMPCMIATDEALHHKLLRPSPERNRIGRSRRKLLILDINGLLADIVAPVRPGYKPDIMVSRKAVFTRPFCKSFLQFCFEKFDVGVWSSRVKKNVDQVLDFLMGELKNKLIFYWDRSHCTITGFPTVENKDKPLVLKELNKLWEEHQSHFAWEKGKYDKFNTLLLDDSPYKALRNPADTAIFPLSYQYTDVNDCSLGTEGDLRVYLERLAMSDNIPEHVRNNPFGQRPIRETNLSWKYYKKVLDAPPKRRNR